MKMNIRSTACILCSCIVMIVAQGCTSAIEVTSTSLSAPILIDGKSDDWSGHLLYYRNDKLTIGVGNDKSFLFLCVMSSDQSVYRSILMKGLNVWFDTTAGKGKYFGIRYPLDSAPPELSDNREEPPGSMDELLKRRAGDAAKLAVLGEQKESRTEILLPGKNGLDARIGYNPGVFVYEMKVPLGIDIADGMHLAFSPDNIVSIRLETPETDSHASPMRGTATDGMNGAGMDETGMQGEGDASAAGQRGGGGHRPGVTGAQDMHRTVSLNFLMNVLKAK